MEYGPRPPMNDDLLQIQRTLRHRLFEGEGALAWRPARELAAQLLLYLDDPAACWRLSAQWLRDTLDADRADGGFGGYVGRAGGERRYVVAAEARRPSMPLPSVLGVAFDAADPGVTTVWRRPQGLAWIDEVAQERSFSEPMRRTLRGLGTGAKLALPLRDGARPVGLMCADWHHACPRHDAQACREIVVFARQGLGPVLAAVGRLAAEREARSAPAAGLEGLTTAELRVARLVATGLSYKEVARQLGRSVSTVDHQLRQARRKLGVRSTARLAHLMRGLPG